MIRPESKSSIICFLFFFLLNFVGTGQSKNSNLFVPLKLSSNFMEVMGTQQTYQKMNQIRQLMNKYIKEKNLVKVRIPRKRPFVKNELL